MIIQPTDQPRRSMIYRLLVKHGAEFESYQDTAIAIRYPNNSGETEDAKHMAIADLSPLPRIGFKGKDTLNWLQQQSVQIPERANQARRQNDNSLVLRLSDDEHLILSDLDLSSDITTNLIQNWQMEPGRMCYHMPRSDTHCWFSLSGEHTPEMLAKVCGVDMRLHTFGIGQIAQTSVARTNAVVVRYDLGEIPVFYVLADSASADFLWPCLCDAMKEFNGRPVGLAALRSLA